MSAVAIVCAGTMGHTATADLGIAVVDTMVMTTTDVDTMVMTTTMTDITDADTMVMTTTDITDADTMVMTTTDITDVDTMVTTTTMGIRDVDARVALIAMVPPPNHWI